MNFAFYAATFYQSPATRHRGSAASLSPIASRPEPLRLLVLQGLWSSMLISPTGDPATRLSLHSSLSRSARLSL